MFDGTLSSTHQISCINRLLFEAQALSISDMKSRVEPQADAAVRKIPVAERIARQEAQKRRLSGVIFDPETTPSHGIVDRLVDMLEDLRKFRMSSPVTVDSEGRLKLKPKADSSTCDASSALHLRQAWTRRSLAFDLAGLATFAVLETRVQKLFSLMQRSSPEGHSQASSNQLLAADRHLFTMASEALVEAGMTQETRTSLPKAKQRGRARKVKALNRNLLSCPTKHMQSTTASPTALVST